MKTRTTLQARVTFGVLLALTGAVQAGTISVSSTAPIVDGADIAMLNTTGAWDPGGDQGHIWNNRPSQGQTFTTGGAGGYNLLSVTLQDEENNINNNASPFTVRVGTVSGNTFTPVHTETSTNTISYVTNDFMTFNFTTPVALSANTVYAFDWDASGSGFTTWANADTNYAGGTAFSIANNDATNTMIWRNVDRVFHVDLVIPYDTTLTSIATDDWHEAGTWTGGPPNVPTADSLANVHDGYTVTVATGNPGLANDVDIDATSTLQVNDTLTVGGAVDVAAGGTLNAPGTLNAAEVNTAGTTALTGGGTVGTVNVTGGTTTLATPTIDTLDVSGGEAGVGPAGLTVTNLTVGPAGTVSTTGNLNATDMDLGGTVNISDADIATTGGKLTLSGTLNASGTVNVTGDTVIAGPDINITGGHLTIDVPAGGGGIPAGAAGYYSFDNTSGNTVYNDGSVAGKDGTLTDGASLTGGKIGQAMSIADNSNQRLVAGGGGVDLGAEWTIASWFEDLHPVGQWRTLSRGQSNDHQIIVQNNSDNLGSYDNANGGFRDCGFDLPAGDGWHHVAAVGSGSSTAFYVDGVYVGSNDRKSTTEVTWIGNHSGGQPFAQKIDEFFVYNRTLDLGEIQALYNAGVGGGYGATIGDLTMAAGSQLSLNSDGSGAASFGAITAGDGTTIHGSVSAGDDVRVGSSVGTLNIDGNYTQGAGSTYKWEADAGGSDTIAVNGNLDVSGAWNLEVTPLSHNAAMNGQTLMSSTGTIAGPPGASVALADNVYTDLFNVSGATVSQSGPNIVVSGVTQNARTVSNAGGAWGTGGSWDNGVPDSGKVAVVAGGTVQTAGGTARGLVVAGGDLVQTTGSLSLLGNARVGAGSVWTVSGPSTPSVYLNGNEARAYDGGTIHLLEDGQFENGTVKILKGGTLKTSGNQTLAENVEFDPNGNLHVATGTLTIAGGASLPPGALLHYKFDETSGDTAVNSAPGGGNDGIRLGTATWTNDPTRGQVIEFHNNNGSIGVDGAISSPHMTVATWLYADTLQGNWDVVMNHAGWSGGDIHYQFQSGDIAGFDVNGPGDMDFGAFTFNEDQWYHVVVTWGGVGDDARLYVDGEWKQTVDRNPFTVNIAPGNIGAWNGNQRQWDGMMDDFVIYDRALTDQEVETLFSATGGSGGTADFGNLQVDTGATLLNTGTGRLSFNDVRGGGTIQSDIEIRGFVSPGDSPGELTVTGDLILADGASYLWELGPGVYDSILVGGELTLGDWTLILEDFGGGMADPGEMFYLFRGTFGIDPNDINPAIDPSRVDLARWDPSGLTFGVDQTGLYMTGLTVTGIGDIPEPATMLAVGLGIAGLGGYVRRRRRA